MLLCLRSGVWSIKGNPFVTVLFSSLLISQSMVCGYSKAAPSLQGPGVQDSFLVAYVYLKPH